MSERLAYKGDLPGSRRAPAEAVTYEVVEQPADYDVIVVYRLNVDGAREEARRLGPCDS